MSFDFWWLLGFVKPEEDGLLRPYYERALADADFNAKADAIFRKWWADPGCVVAPKDPSGYGDYIDFCYAFLPPELGYDIAGKGDCTFKIDDDSVFRFLILGGHSPCSLLWHLLGPDRADLLPGVRGNALLLGDEVGPALKAVDKAFSDLPGDDEILDRAADFFGYRRGRLPAGERENVLEILRAFPETLAEAANRKCGFFALGMTQL